MATRLDWAGDWNGDWPALAKINLFLHVVGRRKDGYHLLQTAFRFLDVGDSLRFTAREDGLIAQATPLPGVAPEQDLTVRAAQALRAATGIRHGVSIAIDKKLPLGGGLGGGSSDAATTLLALNHLWDCGLSRTRLMEIGLTLGADVSIFIHGHSAFGEGVGEQLTDIDCPPAWYLVVVPPVAVSTAEIFAAPDLKRDTASLVAQAWRPGMGGNDLEAVTCRRYPDVQRHLDCLRGMVGAGKAAMSGSGACCFAEFDDESSARSAFAQLPPGIRGFVARGLDIHPLFTLT